MKCKDCIACKERYIFNGSKILGHTELKHYCTGVKEPFEIQDINKECTEYTDKRDTENLRKASLKEYIIMIINDELSKRGL